MLWTMKMTDAYIRRHKDRVEGWTFHIEYKYDNNE